MKIIHMSLKSLTMWYLNLIWFDKRKDFDPLIWWRKRFWYFASLMDFNFFKRTSKYLFLVFSLYMLYFLCFLLLLFFYACYVWFGGFVVYL
jgi:hypothetical protein